MTVTPTTPEAAANYLEDYFANESIHSFHVTTRYGTGHLAVDEIWRDKATHALNVSVRIPEGYELRKIE